MNRGRVICRVFVSLNRRRTLSSTYHKGCPRCCALLSNFCLQRSAPSTVRFFSTTVQDDQGNDPSVVSELEEEYNKEKAMISSDSEELGSSRKAKKSSTTKSSTNLKDSMVQISLQTSEEISEFMELINTHGMRALFTTENDTYNFTHFIAFFQRLSKQKELREEEFSELLAYIKKHLLSELNVADSPIQKKESWDQDVYMNEVFPDWLVDEFRPDFRQALLDLREHLQNKKNVSSRIGLLTIHFGGALPTESANFALTLLKEIDGLCKKGYASNPNGMYDKVMNCFLNAGKLEGAYKIYNAKPEKRSPQKMSEMRRLDYIVRKTVFASSSAEEAMTWIEQIFKKLGLKKSGKLEKWENNLQSSLISTFIEAYCQKATPEQSLYAFYFICSLYKEIALSKSFYILDYLIRSQEIQLILEVMEYLESDTSTVQAFEHFYCGLVANNLMQQADTVFKDYSLHQHLSTKTANAASRALRSMKRPDDLLRLYEATKVINQRYFSGHYMLVHVGETYMDMKDLDNATKILDRISSERKGDFAKVNFSIQLFVKQLIRDYKRQEKPVPEHLFSILNQFEDQKDTTPAPKEKSSE